MTNNKPFSIAFQILQECPFVCGICNRRYASNERRLSPTERKLMVDILKNHGLKRLTITGGEPLILGAELYDLLRYAHEQEIHTCLSTTGMAINEEIIIEMDQYLDHLLIPVHSLTREGWISDFGDTRFTKNLFETVRNLLENIKNTEIILEISTVLHKQNLEKVIELGYALLNLNSNLIWRIEDYYAMGFEYGSRNLYEINNSESSEIRSRIIELFNGKFKEIYLSNKNRDKAPDFFITPKGDFVTTSSNKYSLPILNVLEHKQLPLVNMRRSWEEYEKYCRKW